MTPPGKYILLAEHTTGSVHLLAGSEKAQTVERITKKASQPVAFTEFDVGHTYEAFLSKFGPRDRQFSLTEIADVAGISYPNAHKWMKDGIFEPSVRGRQGQGRGRNIIFSFHDAFIAGAAGALLRAGCSLETIKTASMMLRGTKGTHQLKKLDKEERSHGTASCKTAVTR